MGRLRLSDLPFLLRSLQNNRVNAPKARTPSGTPTPTPTLVGKSLSGQFTSTSPVVEVVALAGEAFEAVEGAELAIAERKAAEDID